MHLSETFQISLYICALAVVGIYLMYASFHDAATLTVPITFIPVPYAIVFAYLVFTLPVSEITFRTAGTVVIFILMYCMARFLHGGGGDAIAMPLVALVAGIVPTLVMLIAACIGTAAFVLIRALIRKQKPKRDDEYPLIPGITAAYVLYIAYLIIT